MFPVIFIFLSFLEQPQHMFRLSRPQMKPVLPKKVVGAEQLRSYRLVFRPPYRHLRLHHLLRPSKIKCLYLMTRLKTVSVLPLRIPVVYRVSHLFIARLCCIYHFSLVPISIPRQNDFSQHSNKRYWQICTFGCNSSHRRCSVFAKTQANQETLNHKSNRQA